MEKSAIRLDFNVFIDVLHAVGINSGNAHVNTNGAIFVHDDYEPVNEIYSYDVSLFRDSLNAISIFNGLTDDQELCVKVERKYKGDCIECFTFDEIVGAVKKLLKLPSKAAA